VTSHQQDQPRPGHKEPAADGKQHRGVGTVNGSAPGGPAGPGGELVTVKVAAQPGGLVVNW
jgi:hypothetical protein